MSDDKARFELAAKKAGYSTAPSERRDGEFLYDEVQTAWEIWKAAREQGSEKAIGKGVQKWRVVSDIDPHSLFWPIMVALIALGWAFEYVQ